ncbi:hypothetical protein NPIL_192131 [Nephila pilipes]|uniref:Transmembrane protein n=1 Tax=Nephila pilipes TaxID=299642 RepID=A0A8X6NDR4_NEPPI|nr:hypothetical protein NPIL_192131 [Nephila pilipes]
MQREKVVSVGSSVTVLIAPRNHLGDAKIPLRDIFVRINRRALMMFTSHSILLLKQWRERKKENPSVRENSALGSEDFRLSASPFVYFPRMRQWSVKLRENVLKFSKTTFVPFLFLPLIYMGVVFQRQTLAVSSPGNTHLSVHFSIDATFFLFSFFLRLQK